MVNVIWGFSLVLLYDQRYLQRFWKLVRYPTIKRSSRVPFFWFDGSVTFLVSLKPMTSSALLWASPGGSKTGQKKEWYNVYFTEYIIIKLEMNGLIIWVETHKTLNIYSWLTTIVFALIKGFFCNSRENIIYAHCKSFLRHNGNHFENTVLKELET